MRSPSFAPLVRSSDGLRLARHADRFGRDALPRFSEDGVVQWLVEEALMEKLDRHDADTSERRERGQAVEAAQQRVRDRLDQARGSR